jgi:DNA-binding NarL/FixJ family response regulator
MEAIVRGIHVELSAEQIEVLKRVSVGQTYAQIGQALGLCSKSVQRRVLDVRNALGTETRMEALSLLHEAGLLR